MVTMALCSTPGLRAQDAATEERLNRLSGQVESVLEGQQALSKRLDALAKEIDRVREQASKPTGNYAAQEDLKSLANAVKEIDRKRMDDYEKIRTELKNLGKTISASPPTRISSPKPGADATETSTPTKPEKGFEYVVQKGDTLSVIVQAYREKNIKITTDQVLKANPGLKPEKLHVGQKIWIPAP